MERLTAQLAEQMVKGAELDEVILTLPRFDVHQNVDNFLMNGERDGQEIVGTEPAVHG
jgi:hypothetical protein